MLLAVPATIEMADSSVKQLRSVILSCAIAATCSLVTEATFLRLGSAEPPLALEASSNWMATGGVFMTKSNDLSP